MRPCNGCGLGVFQGRRCRWVGSAGVRCLRARSVEPPLLRLPWRQALLRCRSGPGRQAWSMDISRKHRRWAQRGTDAAGPCQAGRLTPVERSGNTVCRWPPEL
ncbi:hypothetical protein XocBAI15_11425 [Xanthomonas oryzae pv. oryzicola]|nr:hypothetical protein XocBAI15_11425 [Xanthomonas oryzae pv. oryzicola]